MPIIHSFINNLNYNIMRVKKNLTQLMAADYVPLQATQEGHLKGGFGSIFGALLGNANLNGNCPVKNSCVMNSTCTVVTSPSPTDAQTSPSSSVNPSASPTPKTSVAPVAFGC